MGTTTPSWVTVVLGLATVVVAMIDFVRSRGDWLPLIAIIPGTLTLASAFFVGYPA